MTPEYTKRDASGHLLTTKSFDSDNGEIAFILMDRKDDGAKFYLTGFPLMPKAEAIETIDRICR